VGMGVEPGLSDVFARYAADHLFSEIDELGTRDGANLVVRDEAGNEIFAPSFSIWTTIEECLNPPVIFEKDKGWFTTAPFSEPEMFDFPEGIGPVECVNVEHEEVLLMPRWLDAKRVTFKYGLGEEFIGVLKTLHMLGLDSVDPVRVRTEAGPAMVAPRDVVAACLPDPATIGPRMTGKTCAGVWVTGTGVDALGRGDPDDLVDRLVHAGLEAPGGVQAMALHVDRNRRARPGGVRRQAVPRPDACAGVRGRLRPALGHAGPPGRPPVIARDIRVARGVNA
jgi:saccharopine dehydrogenase-like NADP-dependent oxidoreductase